MQGFLVAFCVVAGLVASVMSAPAALAPFFSDQSCKEGSTFATDGTITCPAANTCDDAGTACQGRIGPGGGYPQFKYCSCGAQIGDPTNSPVCHAFAQRDSATSDYVIKCAKGSCPENQKCKQDVYVWPVGVKCKCLNQ